ncbi:MAG: polyphenol oxidase family protein, partial [Ramlibacter sp.]
VESNRALFARTIAARPVFLRQVHGQECVDLGASTLDATEADGCVTILPGIACTIMVADCLPVLFAADNGRAVAAAHAGWRGLAGQGGAGVLEAVCGRFSKAARIAPTDLGASALAWLGPCIGPDAFEVGAEVRAEFVEHDAGAGSLFRPIGGGKWLADLPGLARRRLQALGFTRIYGNDGSAAWCTVSNPSMFFSHRRDRVSGRFAASVWLV